MEEFRITREMVQRVALHGACYVPKLGRPISSIPQRHLIWVDEIVLSQDDRRKLPIPLWALSGSGYGEGSGEGSVYGSVEGYGEGYGDGSGYGEGYGEK